MEKTILFSRPSDQVLEALNRNEQIKLNEAAFPYVAQVFPDTVRKEPNFKTYLLKYCIIALELS